MLAGHRDAWTRRSSRSSGRATSPRTSSTGPPPGTRASRRLQRPAPAAARLERALLRGAAPPGRGHRPRAPSRSRSPRTRIELTAAEERCRSLADQVAGWIRQIGRGRRLLDRGRAEDAGCASAWPRRRWTSGQPAQPAVHRGPHLRADLGDALRRLAAAVRLLPGPHRPDRRARPLALGSPFDYPNQVTIHLPRNMPDPSDQPGEFEQEAFRAIAHYLEQTQGKAFVLFTSYKMLEAATAP